jgi:enoyl reductase-like protein
MEPEKKEKPINPRDLKFFIGMCKANKKKFIPLSDYDRSITKSFEKMKSGSSSDVP